MAKPLIFEKFPAIETKIPWTPLGEFPTPVQKLEKLGAAVGHDGLWVKRDDLDSPVMGGNKVRVMEFLLASALAQNKKVAVSPGALGSNQIMSSAIYGNKLGIKIIGIFFKQCPTDYMCKHMLVDQSMGVEFHHVNNPYHVPFVIIWQLLKNTDWLRLKMPFYVPSFGSSATCALGYFNAMFELKNQIDAGEIPEPDYIFVTAGTGGTMSGIELGARVLRMKTKVVGVRITDKIAVNEWMVASIINRAHKLLTRAGADLGPFQWRSRDVSLIHEFFGGEYAAITPEAVAAKKTAAEVEGLTLDTTYTAKTMAATLDYIKKHDLKGKTILFWHTYNTRDLECLIDPQACAERLPEEFRAYFGK